MNLRLNHRSKIATSERQTTISKRHFGRRWIPMLGMVAVLLWLLLSGGISRAATPYRVTNSKLKPFDISQESVAPLKPGIDWHLIKSPNGYQLFARGGCEVLQQLVATLDSAAAPADVRPKPAPSSAMSPPPRPPVSQLKTFTEGDYCAAEIGTHLPLAISGLLDHHPFFDGANSWTAALLAGGFIKTQRTVDESEFTLLMNSRLCRSLTEQEAPAAGDIGAIRFHLKDGRAREAAAFWWLSDDLVFTRDDDSRTSPYALERLNDILIAQHVDRLPARCRDHSVDNNSGCPIELIYKRCAFSNEARSKDSATATAIDSTALTPTLAQVSELEAEVEPVTLGQKPWDDAAFQRILDAQAAAFEAVSKLSSTFVRSLAPTDPLWLELSHGRAVLVSLAAQISGNAMQLSNGIEKSTVIYAHEPWQGAVLGDQMPVAGPTGPVTRYFTCLPFANATHDPACARDVKNNSRFGNSLKVERVRRS